MGKWLVKMRLAAALEIATLTQALAEARAALVEIERLGWKEGLGAEHAIASHYQIRKVARSALAQQPLEREAEIRRAAIEECANVAEFLSRGQAVEIGGELHILGSMEMKPGAAQSSTATTIAATLRALAQ